MTEHATEQDQSHIPIMAQMHDHVAHLIKVPARTFYSDAKILVDGFETVSDYYGLSEPIPMADVYNGEAEAMGAKMIYSDKAMPTVDHSQPLIKRPGDLSKIKVPDWKTKSRLPYFMEIVKLCQERGFRNGANFCAPFSLAVALRTYPKLIRDMRKDPAFAHELFTYLVDDILTPYLIATHEVSGANIMIGADAWAAFPNLSIPMLEEWVVPYIHRLAENLMPHGIIPIITGSADYCEENPANFDGNLLKQALDIQYSMMGEPFFVMFMGRWQDLPLEPLRDNLAQYHTDEDLPLIQAGVNARMLRDGPVELIVDAIKRYIHAIGRDNNVELILANIPADTPPNHVHAAVAAAKTYGNYPIAKDLDALDFKISSKPSFEEFMKGKKI